MIQKRLFIKSVHIEKVIVYISEQMFSDYWHEHIVIFKISVDIKKIDFIAHVEN